MIPCLWLYALISETCSSPGGSFPAQKPTGFLLLYCIIPKIIMGALLISTIQKQMMLSALLIVKLPSFPTFSLKFKSTLYYRVYSSTGWRKRQ